MSENKLTEEQVEQLSDVVDFLDISVMCFGLRTDFQSHLFPGSKRLFELADDIEEIKSSCSCGDKKTSINARFDENGEIITEGATGHRAVAVFHLYILLKRCNKILFAELRHREFIKEEIPCSCFSFLGSKLILKKI